jgi:hypothetical protein
VRRLVSEALKRHGSAATYVGNIWREMAAGMAKDDGAVRLPGGGAGTAGRRPAWGTDGVR